MRKWIGWVVPLLGTACPPPSLPHDAGAVADAGAAVTDAGPAAPQLSFALREHLLDGGLADVPVEPGARPTLEPAGGFELDSNIRLFDYRVRLFDENDRVLPSDDGAEDTSDGLRYHIALGDPLKPGHRYSLVLDAQTGATFTDAFGRSHPDLRLQFQIAGERERSPKKKGGKHRRN
jgi:hypothetical protein